MRTKTLIIFLVILVISVSHSKSIEKSGKNFSPTRFEEKNQSYKDGKTDQNSAESLQSSHNQIRSRRDVTQDVQKIQDVGETTDWITKNKWIIIGVGVVLIIMIICCIWDTICCCC